MEARYKKNAGAVYFLKYHLVFCPKYRRPVLTGEVEARLRQLLDQKAAELGVTVHNLEVLPDHVDLFIDSHPTRCVAEIVNRYKGFSSRVLRQEFPGLRSRLPCLWSRNYYAGTVGAVSEPVILRYIDGHRGK